VTSFAQAGQASVALLVTQLVETVEVIVTDRFERVIGLQRNARLKPGELLGDFAGLSTQLTLATLRQVEALYLGAHEDGLSALVQQSAPEIDTHLRSLLREALHASAAIAGPLERVVRRDASPIERARERAKALELAFKVELTSALAVTLSIAAGDGD
jgi:predicted lipoprotein